MTHRLAVLGVVGGMTLAALPGAAMAGLPTINTGCVVQQVDERGQVTGSSVAREGTVSSQFRCVSGQWELARSPFDRGDAITSPEIQVNRAGVVSAQRIVGPALSYDLSLAEMAAITQAITGDRMVVTRAIVAVDDGRQRTPAQVQALLAGEDTTGVRVLSVVDRPDAAKSARDLIDEVGGTPETTVVYFSIWGAIKGFFSWVADKLSSIGDWIDSHCHWEFTPPPDNMFVLVCHW